jgi:hypothetical protein
MKWRSLRNFINSLMFFSNYNNDDQENFESNSEIQLENFEHQIFLEVEKYRRIISEDNFKLVKQVSSL